MSGVELGVFAAFVILVFCHDASFKADSNLRKHTQAEAAALH